jgi:transcriptional regulator with XRE-family HTH domain
MDVQEQSQIRTNLTTALQERMQQVGLSSFTALARAAGISRGQILKLRRGEVGQMRVETLLKLSQVLQVSLEELVVIFSGENTKTTQDQASADLERECQRLQHRLEQQREDLWQEFQYSSLQLLESWLIQWPTAAQKAQENPQLPAVKLLPLMRPLEQLLQQWGVEAIASVGTEIPYDPQLHQLLEGTAQPGDRVKVRYTGYRHGDKLLNRAKVSPTNNLPFG